MIRYIYILFFFFSFASYAQVDGFVEEKYSKEPPAELEMSNRGVFISTSLGAGLSIRKSTGAAIKNVSTASIPIVGIAEIGIARNLRVGVTIERNGNRVASDDSLKIYSLNYGLSFSFRVANSQNSFVYIRTSVGLSDLQISGATFFYGNIKDSIVMISKKGIFVNLVVGQQLRLQKGINFFYQAKFGYLNYPEIKKINFITNASEILYSDNPSKQLNLSYKQVLIEVGFTFKI